MSNHWKRSFACCVVMAFASLSMAPAASPECLASGTFDARQLLQDSALVFAGTLVEGDDYTLIFRPDRIWKGEPSDRATVYVVGLLTLDSYRFEPGQRYLVAAHVLRKEERWSINLDDRIPTAYGVQRPCGSPLPHSLVPALDKLARPRNPR